MLVGSTDHPAPGPEPRPVRPSPEPPRLRRHRAGDPRLGQDARSRAAPLRRQPPPGHTCQQWAYSAITVSPGARAHYDRRRAAGDRHEAALRSLANKLVGQLDHCLRHDGAYRQADAWLSPLTLPVTATAA